MHPDLVGQLADGATLFGVEAKGTTDVLTGLAQAEAYQAGFHLTFLAADASVLGDSYVAMAQRKNVGVIAASTGGVQVIHLPDARQPLRDAYEFVARQLSGVEWVSQRVFTYNLPTHSLAWCIALEPGTDYPAASLPLAVTGYPMPASWRDSLDDAAKLDLVMWAGGVARLTDIGAGVKALLPYSLPQWAEVHTLSTQRGAAMVQFAPDAAAILRLLLLHDPVVRLAVEELRMLTNQTGTFRDLGVTCDALDHARAPVVFLFPEAAARLTDSRGRIQWSLARPEDWRTTTYFQWKSLLKHAGIILPTALGGSSSKNYRPTSDVWVLAGLRDI
jgi:hypothetical protein